MAANFEGEAKVRAFASIAAEVEKELRDVVSGQTGSKIISEEKILGLQFQIESQKREIEFLKNQIEILQENSQSNLVFQEQNNVEEYLIQIQNLSSENQGLVNTIEKNNAEYENNIKNLTFEKQKLEEELSNTKNEFTSHIQTLESENMLLQEQLKKPQIQESNVQDISNYVREISQLKQKNANLASTIEKITDEQKILKDENSKLQIQINQFRKESDRATELTHHNGDLITENSRLIQQINQLKKDFDLLQVEKSNQSAKSVEYEIQIANLQSQILNLQNKLDSLKSEEGRKLSQDQIELYEQTLKQNEDLKQQIDELQIKFDEKDKNIQSYEEIREDLTKKINELIEQNSELRISVEVKDANTRKDRTQINILNSNISGLNKNVESLERQKTALQNEINNIHGQIEQLTAEKLSIKQESERFTSTVCSLLSCSEKKEVIPALEATLEKLVSSIKLSEKSAALQSQVEFEQSKNSTLSRRIDELKAQLEEERSKTTRILDIQTDEVSIALKKQNQSLVSQNKNLQNEIDRLSQEILEKDANIEHLKITTISESTKQVLASSKSERLSNYEVHHQRTVEFLRTLSMTIERTLSPGPTNANRIHVIDNLADSLENVTISEQQVSEAFNNFGSLLFGEFMKPEISDLALSFKNRAQQYMDVITEKVDIMKEKLDKESLRIDLHFRGKSAITTPSTSTPIKRPPIYGRSPVGKSPKMRFDPHSMTPRNSPYFNKSRSPFSNSFINEEPVSVRIPMK
ncbi:hypothetical protein TVAG_389360 [Trichomonas vaginalis G3]|uniref:Uncharacterized protein n=1 Tax=Trichomonas vaginalis (strain ATCC PRA-98 / G3) TaxID=412133 RepID=A2FXI5_TRIV3|nr:A-type inclusion protein-related family [Trichomonas vaginalis G3]EAX90382.1 hypothetical protein TVAG_389360 [Trichomonas vaginalis G3]KAI5545641.1 A-type inclusion protein-related family [Trichomonas vaginalis G3]|eukprot:XP_001303312.1 hypothetical protein [Trichomonas vaginalis G3]